MPASDVRTDGFAKLEAMLLGLGWPHSSHSDWPFPVNGFSVVKCQSLTSRSSLVPSGSTPLAATFTRTSTSSRPWGSPPTGGG
jgi:hypothetical protein